MLLKSQNSCSAKSRAQQRKTLPKRAPRRCRYRGIHGRTVTQDPREQQRARISSREQAHLRASTRFPRLPRRRVRPPQRRGDPPHGRGRAGAGALAGRHGVPGPPERRGGRWRRVRRGGAAAGGGEGGALDAQPAAAAGPGGGRLARGGGGCRALGPGRGPRHRRRASRACHAGRGSPPVRGARRRRGQWHCRE